MFHHLRTLNEKSLEFLPETSSQLSKLFLGVQATISGEFILLKIVHFCVFFVFWLIQLHFWLILFGRVCKTALYVPDEVFEEKLLVWEFFFQFYNRFRILPEGFWSYGANCVPALSKVHIFRQRNKLRKLLFWKNVYTFNIFRLPGWIFPGPQWQFLKVPSNFKLLCSKQHFGLKYIFQTRSSSYHIWTLSKTYSDFWLGTFAHCFHNCNYVSIATSSSKTFSLKKFSFEIFFRFYAEFFHVLVRKVTTELTKVHFLCPKVISWKRNILKKNKTYLTFTDLTELFLRFGMKLQQSYQIFTFCARRFFWAKSFVLKKSLFTELFSNCERRISGRILLKKLPRSPEENFHCKKIHFKEIMFFWVYTEVCSGKLLVKTFSFFCEKILFVLFKFWLIQLHFWLIFVRQGLQNCTLCATRSFRGKTFGLRIFLSILQPFPDFTERLPVLWR